MESLGEQVFRLFHQEINFYKTMFEKCEADWVLNVTKHHYFESDFQYVASLPTLELRLSFWTDKLLLMNRPTPRRALGSILGYWYQSPDLFWQTEKELLNLLRSMSRDRSYRNILPDYDSAFSLINHYPFSLL